MAERYADLDARRAARAEALGEAPTFRLGGQTFTLPVEMPMALLESVARISGEATGGALVAAVLPALEIILGPEQWVTFVEVRPSLEDVVEVADFLFTAYAVDPQTPSASKPSSRATGKRSKPTSKRATASTPARRSTAPKPSVSAAS